ncbi:hypothetical protein Desor_3757 [Desulfosporosinus orientis DSM 765]|uniref:Uncharacterized protein n=1 Tax=Desulfosporosinus orientis (strain ATCC 19365 / DSM 765 / NCIMB 8382 / VKM B-1628 / Singapore I) TaxID=768706 RepID=G7W6T8_DESOD|nr:hypothetical protein [Desulfosporosinus orientis]AET69220.1 hypothetical protein Desor_3757 [Desulfosporosinus orientis DSM 765]
MNKKVLRRKVLQDFGATASETYELLQYNENVFLSLGTVNHLSIPLPDEPFVAAWEKYALEAKSQGVYATLRENLVQLQFPIQEGISTTEGYKAVVNAGGELTQGEVGLCLEKPELLELIIHPSSAGKIPLIITRHRNDFVSLVRALTMKNEPKPIPDSMGAQMISGYNNWGRIKDYRRMWGSKEGKWSEGDWQQEFQRLIPQKELYQDRFIILSNGFYSAVQASELRLSPEEWREASLVIRREHECTHYFTRRVFSSMRNNLLDELIADYMGITGAMGTYRASWFLRFIGLEEFPLHKAGGRINLYRGTPPLSDGAFEILKILVKASAETLESFHMRFQEKINRPGGRVKMLLALAQLTLEELAFCDGELSLKKLMRLSIK